MLNLSFQHKTVWVTGSAQGIGYAVAHAFYAQGATVIGLDNQPQPEQPFTTRQLDISDANAVSRCCQELLAGWPQLDILVNAAGVLHSGQTDSTTPTDWLHSFAVNVHGPFYLLQQLLPWFKAQRSGSIVSISSNAAHVPRLGMAAYGAAKAAQTQLFKTVGLELAGFGVRCNLVSPGSTDTPMLQALWPGQDIASACISGNAGQFKLGIPLQKIATPQDIAHSVLFLCSGLAGHITMQDIVVDGGATLGA